jgi:hypothetical protein
MKINNTITITGEIKRNDRGTHDWGNFTITSAQPLDKKIVAELAGLHGFGGQSFTFSETNNAPYTYDGSFDCWSD